MRAPGLTSEQHAHLDDHIAGIGHNQGPALLDHADTLLERAHTHHRLREEAAALRVMLDMLRAHVSGDYVLPARVAGFVAAGLSLVGVMTGVAIVTQPFSTLLLDAVVVAAIVAALHGEMDAYADWRAARDPAYAAVREELRAARQG
jgi:hypothetical protein